MENTFQKINILIIDDDVNLCANLKDILSADGYSITSFNSVAQAREELRQKSYNLIITDLKLPDGLGLELFKEAGKIDQDIQIIVLTGFASLESSLAALNEGAFAYIQKPINMDELKITIKRALKVQQLSISKKELVSILKEKSLKDPLTGIYNYRYLRERLSSEFKRAKRYLFSLSIIMLDIDYFKSINDIYGHQYGDHILKTIAAFLTKSVRGNDVVARYGGDEFLILMPDTDKNGVFELSKDLLAKFNNHIFDPKFRKLKITLSLGIATYPDLGINAESNLLTCADEALCKAKILGRNRAAIYRKLKSSKRELFITNNNERRLTKLREALKNIEHRINQNLFESILTFIRVIETKDYYLSENVEGMIGTCIKVGQKLKLNETEIKNLRYAAILHNLGKAGIPDKILTKKTRLTKREYKIIKAHPQSGACIIKGLYLLNSVVPLVLYHHTRFDGCGHGYELKGEQIPLGARIIAVVETYQALVSERPYRKAYRQEEAIKIIKEGAGSYFDPKIVRTFMKVIEGKKKFTTVKSKYS